MTKKERIFHLLRDLSLFDVPKFFINFATMKTPEQYKILVVDDEQDLCDILAFNLESEGYLVSQAYSAEEVLEMPIKTFDFLLLDVMMGTMSGFELAQKLKQDPECASIPIVFLTAKDSERDKLKGFGLGADDYIAKPFSVLEVLARIKAVLKRSAPKPADKEEDLSYKGLKLKQSNKSVTVDGKEVAFTKTEYELLELLLRHKGRVFSRQELIDNVWPHDVVVLDRTVDVNITRMRKKISPYSALIRTRLGFGYYFDA